MAKSCWWNGWCHVPYTSEMNDVLDYQSHSKKMDHLISLLQIELSNRTSYFLFGKRSVLFNDSCAQFKKQLWCLTGVLHVLSILKQSRTIFWNIGHVPLPRMCITNVHYECALLAAIYFCDIYAVVHFISFVTIANYRN